MKICAACGERKHEAEFSVSLLTTDGLSKRCMVCIKAGKSQKYEYRNKHDIGDVPAKETAVKAAPIEVKTISLSEELLVCKQDMIVNRKLGLERDLATLEQQFAQFSEKRDSLKGRISECNRVLGKTKRDLVKYRK